MQPGIAPPDPTPPTDRRLPGPAPRALTLLTVLGTVLLVVATVRAAVGVRQLRDRGSSVPALDHEVDLPGRFPPRWLVVLGDSAAAGHGLPGADLALARLVGEGLRAADGRATAVRSAARDGAWTASVIDEQLADAAGAEVVVIGVGVNDAVRPHHRIDEVADATRTLLERVREVASPDARVVLLTCPDLSVATGVPFLLRWTLGRRCRRVAAAQLAVAAQLGVPAVTAGRSEITIGMLGPDGFHPGPEAHRLLSERVIEALTAGPSAG